MSENNQEVKEVIIYRVKPDQAESFAQEGIEGLRTFASNQPGMQRHISFRSIKQPDVFVDFVSWDSLENAEAAVAKMDELSKSDEMQDMMATFEKVEFFDHFKLVP